MWLVQVLRQVPKQEQAQELGWRERDLLLGVAGALERAVSAAGLP